MSAQRYPESVRYTMLLHLPRLDGYGEGPRVHNGPSLAGHGAEAVRDAIAAKIATLPEHMRATLTWDQGSEMAQHAQLTIDTGIEVYLCDPHSPWQRGTNENINGPLRQYFPQRHRPDEVHRSRTRRRRPHHEQQTAQDPGLGHPHIGSRPATLAAR